MADLRALLILATTLLSLQGWAAPVCEELLRDELAKESTLEDQPLAVTQKVALWRRAYNKIGEIGGLAYYVVSSEARPGLLVKAKTVLLPMDLDAGMWRQRGHATATALRSVVSHAVPLPHFVFERLALSPVERVFRKLLKDPKAPLNAQDLALLEKYRLVDRWNEWREWYQQDRQNLTLARKVYQTAYRALLIFMFLQVSSTLLTETDSQSLSQYMEKDRIDLKNHQIQVVVNDLPVPYLALRIGQAVHIWQDGRLKNMTWFEYLKGFRDGAVKGQQAIHLATLNLTEDQVNRLRQELASLQDEAYNGDSEVNNSASRMVDLLEKHTPVRIPFYWRSSPSGVIASLSSARLLGLKWAGALARLDLDSSVGGVVVSKWISIIESQLWGRYFWTLRQSDAELALSGDDKSFRDGQARFISDTICEDAKKNMTQEDSLYALLVDLIQLPEPAWPLMDERIRVLTEEAGNTYADSRQRRAAQCKLDVWKDLKAKKSSPNKGVPDGPK